MDEFFDEVYFDKDIEFEPVSKEENDEEDSDETFDEVLNLFFPQMNRE